MDSLRRISIALICLCSFTTYTKAQKVEIPNWIAQPMLGEYIGISPTNSPKELSLCSAVLSYILSHDIKCSRFLDENHLEMGDLVHSGRNALFCYNDTISYCLKRVEKLKSGEIVSVLTDGEDYKVNVLLKITFSNNTTTKVDQNDKDEYCLQCMMLINETAWVFDLIKDIYTCRCSNYLKKNRNEYSISGEKNQHLYRKNPRSKYNGERPLSPNAAIFSFSDLQNNLSDSWNQMLCEALVSIGYNDKEEVHITSFNEVSPTTGLSKHESHNSSERMERNKTTIKELLFFETTEFRIEFDWSDYR